MYLRSYLPEATLAARMARLWRAVSPEGWRARRERRRRFEQVQIEREVERRRRYYCRRLLRGLDAAVAGIEEEMAAMPTGELVALTRGEYKAS